MSADAEAQLHARVAWFYHREDQTQAEWASCAGTVRRGSALAWGSTLRQAIRAMPPTGMRGISVTSLMGGLTRGSELNTFEVASSLARRLDARCFYLAAPIYAGSRRSRDTILAQDVCTDMTERMRAVGLPLDALRRVPTVILAAGGVNKAPVIAAALRGRLGHVLISGQAAARAVLAQPIKRRRKRGRRA